MRRPLLVTVTTRALQPRPWPIHVYYKSRSPIRPATTYSPFKMHLAQDSHDLALVDWDPSASKSLRVAEALKDKALATLDEADNDIVAFLHYYAAAKKVRNIVDGVMNWWAQSVP